MVRLLYALALGVVGAGIVHVAILSLLPAYSQNDVWSRLSSGTPRYAPIRLEPGGARSTPVTSNPFLAASGCRFDLADGVVHLQASGSVPFWSMSIFDSNGLNVFSISDRAASEQAIDILVANPAQMQQLRVGLPADFARSLFVEADVEEGIALVRAFMPDATWGGVVDAFLDDLSCEPRRLN